MIRLRGIGEFRRQQINHGRYLLMLPRDRKLLHDALNLLSSTTNFTPKFRSKPNKYPPNHQKKDG